MRDLFIDRAAFDAWRARYAARLREDSQDDDVRASAMRAVNPAYVLRNHLAEQAIQAAQQGDYQPIERLRALADPYREHPANAELAALPPDWAQTLSVSCSSQACDRRQYNKVRQGHTTTPGFCERLLRQADPHLEVIPIAGHRMHGGQRFKSIFTHVIARRWRRARTAPPGLARH